MHNQQSESDGAEEVGREKWKEDSNNSDVIGELPTETFVRFVLMSSIPYLQGARYRVSWSWCVVFRDGVRCYNI